MEKILENFRYTQLSIQEYDNFSETIKISLKKIFPYGNKKSFVKFLPCTDNDVYPELIPNSAYLYFPFSAIYNKEIERINSISNIRVYLYKGIIFTYLYADNIMITDLNSYEYIITKYVAKKLCGFLLNKCSRKNYFTEFDEYYGYLHTSEYYSLGQYAKGKNIETVHYLLSNESEYDIIKFKDWKGYSLKGQFAGINIIEYIDEEGDCTYYMNEFHYSQLEAINDLRLKNF